MTTFNLSRHPGDLLEMQAHNPAVTFECPGALDFQVTISVPNAARTSVIEA